MDHNFEDPIESFPSATAKATTEAEQLASENL